MKLIRNPWRRLMQINAPPETIAKGFALGSFIGMMPIPGFQVIVSVGLAYLFKWHKTAAGLGVFNTNLFTGLFIFYFNFQLGKTLLGIHPEFPKITSISWHFFSTMLDAGADVLFALLVGGIITGSLYAAAAYYVTRTIFQRNRISYE